MAKAKTSKKQEVEVEAEISPIEESRELEVAQSEAKVLGGDPVVVEEEKQHLILTRDNLTMIAPRLYTYRHDSSLSECKVKSAFHGQMARDFGLRVGDIVICSNKSEAVLVVVQE